LIEDLKAMLKKIPENLLGVRDRAILPALAERAGLATSAAIAGKSERAIMNQTGHRSVAMVRRYIRDGNLFRDNAAEGLGL
jgi:chorismate mutase